MEKMLYKHGEFFIWKNLNNKDDTDEFFMTLTHECKDKILFPCPDVAKREIEMRLSSLSRGGF